MVGCGLRKLRHLLSLSECEMFIVESKKRSTEPGYRKRYRYSAPGSFRMDKVIDWVGQKLHTRVELELREDVPNVKFNRP